MGKFLTGPARLQQTSQRRVWKLLDNELYMDDDGTIYLTPASMLTDCYTIPCWIAWLAGSPIDNDVRGALLHDQVCFTREAVVVNLTESELIHKGYLCFNKSIGMYICKNIPPKYLSKKRFTKLQANNILYKCMKAANVKLIYRSIIRLGVCFNIGWYLDAKNGLVFELDLNKIYDENYWEINCPYHY